MNKKGFTLIELLAVIVILAIIALIATPVVLNLIEDSRKESTKISFEHYLDSVNQAVARENLTSYFNPSLCSIKNNELDCIEGTLTLDIDINQEVSGLILFDKTNIKNYYVKVNEEVFSKSIPDNCFLSLKEGEISLYKPECRSLYPEVFISPNLKLKKSEVVSIEFNESRCEKYYDDVKCRALENKFNSYSGNLPGLMLFITQAGDECEGTTCAELYMVVDVISKISTEEEYPITSIDSTAFINRDKDNQNIDVINGVVIPDSITKIGQSAFAYNNIEYLYLSKNIEEIGKNAFIYNNIRVLNLGKNIKNIGSGAFKENLIESINVNMTEEEFKAVEKGNDWYEGTPNIKYK